MIFKDFVGSQSYVDLVGGRDGRFDETRIEIPALLIATTGKRY